MSARARAGRAAPRRPPPARRAGGPGRRSPGGRGAPDAGRGHGGGSRSSSSPASGRRGPRSWPAGWCWQARSAATSGWRPSTARARGPSGEQVHARGHLLTLPRAGPFGTSVEARVTGGPRRGARLVLRLERGRRLPARAGPGAEVRFAGFVRPAPKRPRGGFDVRAWHRRRGHRSGADRPRVRAHRPAPRRAGRSGRPGTRARPARDRARAAAPGRGAGPGHGAGPGRAHRQATRDEFRASGLAHVLAVSGQNVMLLAALALPLMAAAGVGHRARLAADRGADRPVRAPGGCGSVAAAGGVMGRRR